MLMGKTHTLHHEVDRAKVGEQARLAVSVARAGSRRHGRSVAWWSFLICESFLGIDAEFVRVPRHIIPPATSLLLGNSGFASW